jgi:hypothetical protein
MDTLIGRSSLRSPLAWLLPLALGLCGTRAWAQGPETDKCNENQGLQGLSLSEAAGRMHAELTGTPLEPGHTVLTEGTNASESPELNGLTEFTLNDTFSIELAGGGLVKGSYAEMNKTGTDTYCKQHLKVKVKQGCVAKVRFRKYTHPLDRDIVADYRDDLSGLRASDTASRSNSGTVIEFHLATPVCAGETTRWLLLNTSINTMTKVNGLEFVAPTGERSKLRPVHVPLPVQ